MKYVVGLLIVIFVFIFILPRIHFAGGLRLSGHLDCEAAAKAKISGLIGPNATGAEQARLEQVKKVLLGCPSWVVFRAINVDAQNRLEIDPDDLLDLFGYEAPARHTLYTIGKRWSRFVPTSQQIEHDARLEWLAGSVFCISGSAFYLGEVANEPIFATNAHVIATQKECDGKSLEQPRLPGAPDSLKCRKLIAAWPDIEFTLFTSSPPTPAQKHYLRRHALKFDFSRNLPARTRLMTAGYGGYKMKNFAQTWTNGSPAFWVPSVDLGADCILGDDLAKARPITDPDSVNRLNGAVWSIPTGCGFSHGDSGSPVLNADTLRVIAINWTLGDPKPRGLEYAQMTSEQRWKYSSFASPAWKIGERLAQASHDSNLAPRTRQILRSILARAEN